MSRNKNSSTSVYHHVYRQPYATSSSRIKLYNAAKGSRDFVQRLGLLKKLAIHNGCVNCITWSDDGRLLLSGSDDQHLIVSNAYNHKILTDYKTSHRANIFCARFLPCTNDSHVVSCAGDGMILYTDITRPNETHQNLFNCHSGTTYKLVTIPNDPYSFLSCGEDFTVRCFDLRTKQKCSKHQCTEDVLINCGRAVTALAVNPWASYQFAVGSADSTVRLYDGRMLNNKPEVDGSSFPNYLCSFTVPSLSHGAYRITSLAFSPEGEEILASYSAEYLYLFNIKNYSKCELNPNSGRTPPQTRRSNSHNAATQSNFPAVRRLRLRGDWSDTGPDARPEQESNGNSDPSPARRSLHAIFMRRMTNAIFRIFNSSVNRGGSNQEVNEDVNMVEQQEAPEVIRNENEGETEENSALNERGLNISVSESRVSDSGSSNNSPLSCQRKETQTCNSSPSTSHSAAENVQLPSFEQTYSSLVKQPKSSQSGVSISQSSCSSGIGSSKPCSMDTDDPDMVASASKSSDIPVLAVATSQPSTSSDRNAQCLAVTSEPTETCPSIQDLPTHSTVATQTEVQLNSTSLAVNENIFTLASFLSNVPQILSTSNYLRQTDDAISSLIQSDGRHSNRSTQSVNTSLLPSASVSRSVSDVELSSFENSAASHAQEPTNVSSENCDSLSNLSNEPRCKNDNSNNLVKPVSNSNSESTYNNVPASKLMPCTSSESAQNLVDEGNVLKNKAVDHMQHSKVETEALNFSSVKAQIDAISCQESEKPKKLSHSEIEDMNDPSSSSSCSSSCSNFKIDSASCNRDVKIIAKNERSIQANDSSLSSVKGSECSFQDVTKTNSENLSGCSDENNDEGMAATRGSTCTKAHVSSNTDSPSLISQEIVNNQNHEDVKSSSTSQQSTNQPVLSIFSNSPRSKNCIDSELSNNEESSLSSSSLSLSNDGDDAFAELLDSHAPNVSNGKEKSEKSEIHSSCESICESNNFDGSEHDHEDELEENEYPFITQKYTGHRNARTMIKEATFWGNNYVMSGSDCGHVFIWDRWTAKLTMLLRADNHVVNCIQPHPFQPILATSGIDYDVKLWAPINEETSFDEERAQELMQRNIIMLEETKDTITVPASFALRMLAFLSQIRRGRRLFPNVPEEQ